MCGELCSLNSEVRTTITCLVGLLYKGPRAILQLLLACYYLPDSFESYALARIYFQNTVDKHQRGNPDQRATTAISAILLRLSLHSVFGVSWGCLHTFSCCWTNVSQLLNCCVFVKVSPDLDHYLYSPCWYVTIGLVPRPRQSLCLD